MVNVSSIICNLKNNFVCENCNEEISFSLNNGCYINLVDGSVRVKCPHCHTEYKLYYDLVPVEKNKDEIESK